MHLYVVLLETPFKTGCFWHNFLNHYSDPSDLGVVQDSWIYKWSQGCNLEAGERRFRCKKCKLYVISCLWQPVSGPEHTTDHHQIDNKPSNFKTAAKSSWIRSCHAIEMAYKLSSDKLSYLNQPSGSVPLWSQLYGYILSAGKQTVFRNVRKVLRLPMCTITNKCAKH